MNNEQEVLRNNVFAHYDRLMECKTREDFIHEGWKSNSCALCAKYEDCHGCPIAIHTGHSGCVGTPWRSMNYVIHVFVHCGGEPPYREIANMLEFLRNIDWGVQDAW